MGMIGLTGGIGSGKSRVAEALAKLNSWPLLSADQAAAAIMMPGRAGWQAIKKLNSAFIGPDDILNRPALRQAIFADPVLRQEIDDLIHPLVKDEIIKELATFSDQANEVIIEVPLLFEAGWQEMFTVLVCVDSPQQVCIERIMERDGVTEEQARQAVFSQLPLASKVKMSDVVIDNGGSWATTYDQLKSLPEMLKNRQ